MGQGLFPLEGDPVHPFLFFHLESVKLDPWLNFVVFFGYFYWRMVFPVCCVDVALKQGGDPPHQTVQGFLFRTLSPELVPPGPSTALGQTFP